MATEHNPFAFHARTPSTTAQWLSWEIDPGGGGGTSTTDAAKRKRLGNLSVFRVPCSVRAFYATRRATQVGPGGWVGPKIQIGPK